MTDGWIDMDEDYPGYNQIVLLTDRFYPEIISIGYINSEDDEIYSMYIHDLPIDFNPTHWQALPQKLKTETHDD